MGGDNVIIDSVEATAVFICFYYILVAISAVIIFSKDPNHSFFNHILIPAVAALVMVTVLLYTIVGLLPEDGDDSLFLGGALNIVILCSVIGLIVLAVLSKRDFFKKGTAEFTGADENGAVSVGGS